MPKQPINLDSHQLFVLNIALSAFIQRQLQDRREDTYSSIREDHLQTAIAIKAILAQSRTE